MTDLDLNQLKTIAQALPQGNWSSEPSKTHYLDGRVEPSHEIIRTWINPDDYSDPNWETILESVDSPGMAAHIAAFDPPTVLALIARIEQLEAAQQRVRDQHPMMVDDGIEITWCGTCTEQDAAGNYVIWDSDASAYPCPTIKAIEGDQA